MKIYVVTHKKVENPLPVNYEYFQVNAKNNAVFCELNDALGEDNISEKNANYCELTATYWIWKNDNKNDIVGLAHYRRFLTGNKFSSSPKSYLNSPRVEKYLEKYDFLATKLYKTNCTVKEHIMRNVRNRDMVLLRDAITKLRPEYLAEYDRVLAGKKSYLLNVFVCKKENWNKYCEWLFPIFEEMEKRVDMTGYSEQEQRLYGFLAERLFTVYVNKNNYKVKSFSTHLVGVPKRTIAADKLLKLLHIKN